MIYLDLILGFLKVGLFSFGGAYAAIPLIREIVMSYGWLTDEALSYMIAVSESTPGPIMVNLATYVGSSQAGFFGAVIATLAVVLPSFLIILPISYVLKEFQELQAVKYAFAGIRAGVLALLIKSLWTMYKKSPKGWVSYVVIAGAFLATAFLKINVLYVIIGCAVFGIVTSLVAKKEVGQ